MTAPRTTPSGVPIPAGYFDNQVEWMNRLDAEAMAFGAVLKAQYPDTAALRARAAQYDTGNPWLAATNRELASELDTDPRLAAASHLAKSTRDGSRIFFLNQYRTLLLAHLARRPARVLAAAE